MEIKPVKTGFLQLSLELRQEIYRTVFEDGLIEIAPYQSIPFSRKGDWFKCYADTKDSQSDNVFAPCKWRPRTQILAVNKLIRNEALQVYRLKFLLGFNRESDLSKHDFDNLPQFLCGAVREMSTKSAIDALHWLGKFPNLEKLYLNSVCGDIGGQCVSAPYFDDVRVVMIRLLQDEYSIQDFKSGIADDYLIRRAEDWIPHRHPWTNVDWHLHLDQSSPPHQEELERCKASSSKCRLLWRARFQFCPDTYDHTQWNFNARLVLLWDLKTREVLERHFSPEGKLNEYKCLTQSRECSCCDDFHRLGTSTAMEYYLEDWFGNVVTKPPPDMKSSVLWCGTSLLQSLS